MDNVGSTILFNPVFMTLNRLINFCRVHVLSKICMHDIKILVRKNVSRAVDAFCILQKQARKTEKLM